MANWVFELDNILYTVLKYKIEKAFKEEFPDIAVVNSQKKLAKAKFPNVYIQTNGNGEIGSTFDDGINGITYDVEISVTALDETDAKRIMNEVVEVMVSKHFSVPTNNLPYDVGENYIRISRFRRIVGASDKF